jgi:nitrate reductase (cytochrome), electron transfer subunit
MRGRAARVIVVLAAVVAAACGQAGPEAAEPRPTGVRAAGRAYDGAPPVIPHDAAVGACTTCHDSDGAEIAGIGVAPASPHGGAAADGAMRRCRQCHVPQAATTLLVSSRFAGLPQGPWKGSRATPGAPPRIPHTLQLRGECLTCHAGPAARAEIRTTHPERLRCRQCHVPETPPAP